MSSQLRLAVVGTGVIVEQLVAAAAVVEQVRVDLLVTRDPARGRPLAQRLGIPAVSDFETALADPAIDAVYLATPNRVHHRQAVAALTAGKHVLVEKPATPTAAEWQELVALAGERGLVVLEAMRSAYDPGFAVLAGMLDRLGTLRRVSLRYSQRSARYDKVLAGEQVNIFDPALAGGALYDLGIYTVHPMVRLFGPPRQVVGGQVVIGSGADGAGAALAFYPGMVVDLSFSKISGSWLPSEFQGEAATLVVDHITAPRLIEVRSITGQTEVVEVEGPEQLLGPELEFFVRAVSSPADAVVDQVHTGAALRVVDEIRAGWTSV